MRPGDAVAVLLPPSPEVIVLLHAIPRAGGVLVPLNPGWTMDEIRRGLGGLGSPRLVLARDSDVGRLRRAWPGGRAVAVDEMAPATAEPGGEGDPDPADPTLRGALPEPSFDTPAAVLLTSGSTGTPRAVPLTHGNLLASARGAAERLKLDPMDVWLATLSPAHVGGLALLHRAAVVGCPVVTRPRFDPQEFLTLADAGEISHASLVPTMLRRLLDVRQRGGGERGGGSHEPRVPAGAPRGLRCVLVGGAPTPGSLLERALRGRWPVALTYGLTEATSQVATATPAQVRSKPGTVGRPLPGVGVAIQGRGPDGIGEILVRGPTVVPLGSPSDPPPVHVDAAGWLHTGDLGHFDADGDLWVTGRLSDRIVTGGVTVEPGEVEKVLREHPSVAEVAVLGLPDEEWGERIVALVVPSDASDPPTAEDLLAFTRPRLSAAKRPRVVRVVGALPRNPNGKLDRRALRSQVEDPA